MLNTRRARRRSLNTVSYIAGSGTADHNNVPGRDIHEIHAHQDYLNRSYSHSEHSSCLLRSPEPSVSANVLWKGAQSDIRLASIKIFLVNAMATQPRIDNGSVGIVRIWWYYPTASIHREDDTPDPIPSTK